jgi:hypothetical protein
MRKLLAAAALILMTGLAASQVQIQPGVQINQDSNTTINASQQLTTPQLQASQGITYFNFSGFNISQNLNDKILVNLDTYNLSKERPQASFNYTVNASTSNKLTFQHKGLTPSEPYRVLRNSTEIKNPIVDQSGNIEYFVDSFSTKRIEVIRQDAIEGNARTTPNIDEQHDSQVDYETQNPSQDTQIIGDTSEQQGFNSPLSQLIDVTTDIFAEGKANVNNITLFDSKGTIIQDAPKNDQITINADITSSDGRNNINNVKITIEDPNGNKDVNQASMNQGSQIPNGYRYSFDYQMPNNITDSGQHTISITATDNDGETESLTKTFIYEYYTLIEQPAQLQGDPTLFNDLSYTKEIDVSNPSNEDFDNARIQFSVPKAIIQASATLTDENGNTLPISINRSAGTTQFNTDINSLTTKTFTLDYQVYNPDIVQDTRNIINNEGKDVIIQEFNLTPASGFNYPDLDTSTTFANPSGIVDYKLFVGGQEVTLQQQYNFQTLDEDKDGNNEKTSWTVTSLSNNTVYQVRAIRGFPLEVEREDVVINKPVTQQKNIEWRTGLKFINRNSFPLDVNYKARVPLRASDILFENQLKTKQFDNVGAYIPIQFQLSGNTNQTRFYTYSTPPIDVNKQEFDPDINWINLPTIETTNVTFINQLNQRIQQPQAEVNILQASNLTTTLNNGTVIDERDNVEGGYTFNISSLEANQQSTVSLQYNLPVADHTYEGKKNVSSGNRLDVWSIESISPVARQNTQFLAEDISCVEAQRAYILENNETQELKCRDRETVVNVETLGPNQEFQLGIEHKEYGVIVETGLRFWQTITANIAVATAIMLTILIIATIVIYLVTDYTFQRGENN